MAGTIAIRALTGFLEVLLFLVVADTWRRFLMIQNTKVIGAPLIGIVALVAAGIIWNTIWKVEMIEKRLVGIRATTAPVDDIVIV